MNLSISTTAAEMGSCAAQKVACLIRDAISQKGEARILVSTGQSQFEFFAALLKEEIDWKAVEIFHLDEYIGLPVTHPASFRKYLKERFVDHLPVDKMHYINGEDDAEKVIAAMSIAAGAAPIDIGIIGIGENAHIAFNDPPADFETTALYHVVVLNEACRLQQVNEGWFANIEEVPKQAISATVRLIMSCGQIVSVVPGNRKASAIAQTLHSRQVTNQIPATILNTHPNWNLYLDEESASQLKHNA